VSAITSIRWHSFYVVECVASYGKESCSLTYLLYRRTRLSAAFLRGLVSACASAKAYPVVPGNHALLTSTGSAAGLGSAGIALESTK
jgi:hypothetical protein